MLQEPVKEINAKDQKEAPKSNSIIEKKESEPELIVVKQLDHKAVQQQKEAPGGEIEIIGESKSAPANSTCCSGCRIF